MTSSTLYPGKLVFALPISDSVAYEAFIILHVLLAALFAFLAARTVGCTVLAGGLGAMSYVFGGSIFFQYCNVIFLVGATWLPLAWVFLHRTMFHPNLRNAAGLGFALTMMILGGDPQTVYHVGLVALIYLVIVRTDPTGGKMRALASAELKTQLGCAGRATVRSRIGFLMLAGIITFALSAVQLYPSVEWTRHGDRTLSDWPRSVTEVLTSNNASMTGCYQGMIAPPAPESHRQATYHFSVAPWRWFELVWPNIGGRPFPVNRRWTSVIPAEGRMWTPSLYMGLAPVVFAACGIRLFRGHPWQRCLSWSAILAAVGSLGWFGIGWVYNEVQFAIGRESDVWHPIGGLYWLMAIVLPGYALFRYPAKLWTVSAMGLSLLAAHGFDRLDRLKGRRWIVCLVASVSALGMSSVWLASDQLLDMLNKAPADRFLGPLDSRGAINQIQGSLFHAACISLVLVLIFATSRLRARGKSRAILILTSLELAFAHAWMVPLVPTTQLDSPSSTSRAAEKDAARRGLETRPRVHRIARHWYPAAWSTTSSVARQSEGVSWDRETLLPRYGLDFDFCQVRAKGPFMSSDLRALLDVARHEIVPGDPVRRLRPKFLSILGVQYACGPAGLPHPKGFDVIARGNSGTGNFEKDVALFYNHRALPRVWTVHEIVKFPELTGRSYTDLVQRTRDVFLAIEGHLDRRAVIESDVAILRPTRHPSAPRDSCRIVGDEPNRVEIQANMGQAGYVMLNDLYYPGWKCRLLGNDEQDTAEIPIFRANRVMRAVYVPAGEYKVVFEYRPVSFRIGLLISGISWPVFLLLLGRSCPRKRSA